MTDFGTVDDGMGSEWPRCKADCGVEVVRPGKAQCVPCEEGDAEELADWEKELLARDDPFERRVNRLFQEAADLLLSKHQDYGPLNISLSPGGAMNGLRVRLYDKIARLNNLIDSGREPEHESIEDTWRDLIGYSAIGLLVTRGQWPTE